MSLKDLDIKSVKNQDVSILHQPINNQKTIDTKKFEYLYLGNIPSLYRSSDLRWFFKDSVESKAFRCFHFRHRPEKQVVLEDVNDGEKGKKTCDKDNETYCCIIQVYLDQVNDFIEKYNGKEWRRKDLTFGKRTINIKKLKVNTRTDDENKYKSKKELRHEKHNDNQDVYIEDLKSSIELNPPEYIMPNGNVGTTTKYFHGLIKECKMPPSLIKSLDLEFPTSRKNKAYSNVPMNYGVSTKNKKSSTQNNTDGSSFSDRIGMAETKASKQNQTRLKNIENDSKFKSDLSSNDSDYQNAVDNYDEEEGAEDWERHEALHDDVDNQSRPKERLFEEDIELKWEKGGSGLVFYTDAYYWNEMKGKDFDEDTVDDWDVDYSIYYEDGAGDKPARDQYKIRMEQRMREGSHPIKSYQLRRKEYYNRKQMTTKFAEFERYSKGFGSRILKEQGWSEGSGVGASREGITEPISLDGQGPRSKIGFGYYGEKLDRTVNLKRKIEREIHITTKYDEKKEEE